MFSKRTKKAQRAATNANRGLVLEAARKVLLRDGALGFSLRAVARELRCSPGTIYNYYTDKDELIGAAVDVTYAKLADRIRRIEARGPISERIRRAAEIYIDLFLSHQEEYRIAFSVGVPPKRVDRPHDAYFLVERMVSDAIAAGELRGPASEVVQVVWVILHGLIVLLIHRPNFPWVERPRLINAVLDAVVRSLPITSNSK